MILSPIPDGTERFRDADGRRVLRQGWNFMKSIRKEQQETVQRKRSSIRRHWAMIPAALFLLCAAALCILAGDSAQIGIADNLDLFQAQYQMLKNTKTFFAQGAEAPFLHGVSRDVLPGELSVEALFYALLPSLAAYWTMYFFKVILSMTSFVLLMKELEKKGCLREKISGEAVEQMRGGNAAWNLALLGGLAYGILNLFPSFGISFASIPLLVWMVLRLEGAEKKQTIWWFTGIFCYPLVSYFSYFGIFLLGYLLIAFLWRSIAGSIRAHRGQADVRLLGAFFVLAAGYVLCEYRLFRQMLLGSEATIRDTMVQTSLSGKEILQWIWDVLVNGVGMHCESAHRFVVLPVCLLYFLILNAGYLRRREGKGARRDLYNLCVLILLFNSVVYGLYYLEPFRSFVEKLLPPLKGFQFSRTAFFNPFLWYGMFTIALYRLYCRLTAHCRKAAALTWGLMGAAILSVLLYGNSYNDLLHTAKSEARKLAGLSKENTLSYGEFYSEDLFREACRQIDYDGEWAVAYGFHPAVLEYNGISTLDGYLGFYPQSYKEEFRRVIAPALSANEGARRYYDEWGARCYLYSADQPTIVEAVRNYPHPEGEIAIDPDALQELGCKYLFSRIRITNATEKELTLLCTCSSEESPYILYVYQVG